MTEKGSRKGWPDADWTGTDCPKCGAPFVAKDKYGTYCCVCTWKEDDMNILGKELLVNIEAAESVGDVGVLIGLLLVALDKAREMERRVNEDLEYSPTGE